MIKIKNKPAFKLSCIALISIISLAVLGDYLQEIIFKNMVQEYPILKKKYSLIGLASVIIISTTYFGFTRSPKNVPMLFLAMTIFKLGLFIALFLQEEDLPSKVRIAFIIPIIIFMILEKIYAYYLFKNAQNKE